MSNKAKLKVKTILNEDRGLFDRELEELINAAEEASIQYKIAPTLGGFFVHSAMVLYYMKPELEEEE